MKLTWGDLMIAAAAASSACGPKAKIDQATFFSDVCKILKVTGRERTPAGRQALKGGE